MTSRAAVLTPPGSGAIGVVSVRGPGAWPVLRDLFRPAAGGRLPETPPGLGVWFGRIGDPPDEVILASPEPDRFELHCHGGRQVIAGLVDVLRSHGIAEEQAAGAANTAFADPDAAGLLPFARTTRTAGILLDQANGAYRRALVTIAGGGPDAAAVAAVLRRNVPVGRHLVKPWSVVVAGPPNAGKSTLVNALAGFERSVVSPIPGTTRDAVSVALAFDGWPVDLCDTAGLRDTAEAIEREGVSRTREAVAGSDLVLWVVDATGPRPRSLGDVVDTVRVTGQVLVAFNKVDVAPVPPGEFPEAARVSALTGTGIAELAARIAATFVPEPPAPGEPVPFTPPEWDRWS